MRLIVEKIEIFRTSIYSSESNKYRKKLMSENYVRATAIEVSIWSNVAILVRRMKWRRGNVFLDIFLLGKYSE